MVARAWPNGGATVARAGRRGGRLGAQEAAACRWGALGGDSMVGPRPRQPVDGGGGGGVNAASPFSCAEAEGERNGGGKENWGPDALMMGERGGWSGWRQTRGRCGGSIRLVWQGTAARGPAGRSGGGAWAAAAVGSAHKNSNLFDLFKGIPERSDLIRLKDGLFELKKNQINMDVKGLK
jgi:hypothetical protein